MKKSKILIGPSTFASFDKEPLEQLRAAGCEVIDNPFKRKLTKNELFDLLDEDVSGIIAGLETLDREVMEKSHLKVISRCGSGVSNVDRDAAKEFGIKVYSTPDGPTNAVAELTMASMLSLLRELPVINNSMHSRKWDKRIGLELRNKKLVIIGYGRIGQRVGQLASAFNAEIIAVDPAYNASHGNVKKMELYDALKVADIITLHCSGTEKIIGDKEFEIMKKGIIMLNAGRGELIDENSIIKALDNGTIGGAWIDTFTEEPYSGSLCNYDQVILTSHVGSYTHECRKSMEREAVANLLEGLNI